MPDNAVHVIAHGMVQGVGFRFYVREHASSSGLKGWVKNLPDGTVEIHAEGKQEILQDFITKVEKGPFFGSVSHLTVEWVEPEKKYNSFNIAF